MAGFVSRVLLVPEENFGLVILTNAEEVSAFESVMYHIVDSYFGAPSTEWITAFKAVDDKKQKKADETMKKAAANRAADSKPSLPLGKYAGEYCDPWYGKITIRQEPAGLVIALDRTSKGVGDLEHWQ